jgi:hypothetical protein
MKSNIRVTFASLHSASVRYVCCGCDRELMDVKNSNLSYILCGLCYEHVSACTADLWDMYGDCLLQTARAHLE